MTDILRIFEVVVGIGLVIFVHELGHFLAARLCGVRVEVFSLGFGPRLFGWRRGATDYRVAAVPVGGYVKMAGEEPDVEGRPPRSDELHSKSVGQRFLIYSGGVIMNVLFGLVVFPLIFLHGVPLAEPAIGQTVPGSPAWHARIPSGSRVLEVNGARIYDFTHIVNEVALGDPEGTELRVLEPGAEEPRRYQLVPRRHEEVGLFMLGIQPALDPEGRLRIEPGSPAERAGLESGDRLVELPGAPPGLHVLDQLRWLQRDGDPMRVTVGRDEGGTTRRLTVTIEPEPSESELSAPRLGIIPPRDFLADFRDTELVRELGLEREDRVLTVQGRPIQRLGDLQLALVENPGPLAIEVERAGRRLTLEGPPLSREEALAFADDLNLEIDPRATHVIVSEGEAGAEAGLRDGDRILRVGGVEVGSWDEVRRAIERAVDRRPGEPIPIVVRRSTGVDELPEETIELAATPEPVAPPHYGLNPRTALYTFRTEGFGEALVAGAECSWRFLEDTVRTLRRMLTGDVASKNLGGIITIGAVSYSLAESGWAKLLYFLCIISINLAFLNVLPIPVLDGGHLFFLIIEKIKGSPVSERVMGYSQLVGLVVIVSLMVYVTFNDINRWFS